MREPLYDVIGIGVGPFNLSLACLLQPVPGVKALFLDKAAGFDWHPGIMLQSAHLQTPFLSDLVTLADPTSPFSFLNYIKQQGRIYSFYIRENFFLMRSEYNQYCQWAVERLDNLAFDTEVERIEHDENAGCYLVHARCAKTGQAKHYKTKKLVLGTGTSPHVPACCRGAAGQAVHSSQYLPNKQALQEKPSITVVGSGQSAAEIYHDLLQDIELFGYELSWITRSPRFFPLEYNKLTLEMTSPEYVDYFHGLPENTRETLIASQKPLYKGINGALINDIYDLLYVKSITRDLRVNLLTNSELESLDFDPAGGGFTLGLWQKEQDVRYRHRTEGLVLATGYGYQLPGFVSGIQSRIRWDGKGRFAVNRNHTIDRAASDIFVQNVGLHTHGFTIPDLGMVCHRNVGIVNAIAGYDHYRVERGIAFQRFSALPRETPNPHAQAQARPA